MPGKRMLLSSRAKVPKLLEVPSRSSRDSSLKNLLLHSPLPSPSLPALLPRHGKKPPPLNTRKVLRILFWLAVFAVLYVCFYPEKADRSAVKAKQLIHKGSVGKKYEIVEDFQLPDFASPIAVTDAEGESRWTVSIPPSLGFPLSPADYANICTQAQEIEDHVAELRNNFADIRQLRYYEQDPNFIDVAQAQVSELLPIDPDYSVAEKDLPLCKSSLTYVLDATEAGLGGNLLGLWLSFGLAKRERRAFFIDDSQFPYGRYTTLFAAIPSPKCRAPPRTQRVPYPHLAQHLVVAAATWKWTFGSKFKEQFSQKQIFDMARQGYETLFRLNPEDEMYVHSRLVELRGNRRETTTLAGIHVRRGDRHPREYQYQHGYLPPSLYTSTLKQSFNSSENYTMILGSDDADIYSHPAFEGASRAQKYIILASNKQLKEGGLGWEGGFYRDAFWSIGLPDHVGKRKSANSPMPTRDKQNIVSTELSKDEEERDYRVKPTEQALQLRNYIGRAYLLDLAILSKSDRLVCGVSSRGCRLLGVMMGWNAIEDGYWMNIDGNHGWEAL